MEDGVAIHRFRGRSSTKFHTLLVKYIHFEMISPITVETGRQITPLLGKAA